VIVDREAQQDVTSCWQSKRTGRSYGPKRRSSKSTPQMRVSAANHSVPNGEWMNWGWAAAGIYSLGADHYKATSREGAMKLFLRNIVPAQNLDDHVIFLTDNHVIGWTNAGH
jgi:hypothetical protein